MNFELRPWQISAIKKSTEWFAQKNDKRFLINAAPGAGKTICASMIAKKLLDEHGIWTVAIDGAGVRGCRICPNVYTTTDELDIFVDALAQMRV